MRRAVLVLTVAVVATACSASSRYMRRSATALDTTPPPGHASLVILRPSGFASGVSFTIVDEQGRYLGEPLPGSRYVVHLTPGRHRLLAWGENLSFVDADVVAGRTYYVVARPQMGMISARVNLTALSARTGHWSHLGEWMADTAPYAVDFARGQASLNPNEVQQRLAEAAQHPPSPDPTRTLQPGDGV